MRPWLALAAGWGLLMCAAVAWMLATGTPPAVLFLVICLIAIGALLSWQLMRR
jgi:hypothetical protein